MTDDEPEKKPAVPLEDTEAPHPVNTDAPVSTDEKGKPVDLPDKGGKID